MSHALAPKTSKLAPLLGRSHQSLDRLYRGYCVGPERDGPVCGHNSMLKLADLPDWDWHDISAHLKCTKCGAIGYVDTRLNWSEVINFNKGIGCEPRGVTSHRPDASKKGHHPGEW